VLRLAALDPASLVAQLSVEQLGVLASIVSLHRFFKTFQDETRTANIKNTNLRKRCSGCLFKYFSYLKHPSKLLFASKLSRK
jgi:hypothetical protein